MTTQIPRTEPNTTHNNNNNSMNFFFAFSRQGFSVALEPVLELAFIDQAGLELRDVPASASQVPGLKCVPPLLG